MLNVNEPNSSIHQIRPVVSQSQPAADSDLYRAAESLVHPEALLFLSVLCAADPPPPASASSECSHAPLAGCASGSPVEQKYGMKSNKPTLYHNPKKLNMVNLFTFSEMSLSISSWCSEMALRKACWASCCAELRVWITDCFSRSAWASVFSPSEWTRLSSAGNPIQENKRGKNRTQTLTSFSDILLTNCLSHYTVPNIFSLVYREGLIRLHYSCNPLLIISFCFHFFLAYFCHFSHYSPAAVSLRTRRFWFSDSSSSLRDSTWTSCCCTSNRLVSRDSRSDLGGCKHTLNTQTYKDILHIVSLTKNPNTHLKAASSSDSIVFSLSDAVSWTTSAALSRASSARLRPASSRATSFRWLSPLERLNSELREVTSPQSCWWNNQMDVNSLDFFIRLRNWWHNCCFSHI